MFDLFFSASILLFAVGVIAALVYYKRIRGLREKYEGARDIVGDIIVSYNSQLRLHEKKLDAALRSTETLSSEHEETRSKTKEHEELLTKIATEVNTYSELKQKILAQIQNIDMKVETLASAQKETAKKVTAVENLRRRLSAEPRAEKVKIEAPIPIKREKALAPLTETELLVLKILADDSRRTAREIREEIKLTREHTARLMKKLYEEGYLERNTQRIPYTYRIKKEMLELLRKRA